MLPGIPPSEPWLKGIMGYVPHGPRVWRLSSLFGFAAGFGKANKLGVSRIVQISIIVSIMLLLSEKVR
jgi:hypothetical protein